MFLVQIKTSFNIFIQSGKKLTSCLTILEIKMNVDIYCELLLLIVRVLAGLFNHIMNDGSVLSCGVNVPH